MRRWPPRVRPAADPAAAGTGDGVSAAGGVVGAVFVRKALASGEPPRYERASKGSIVDAVEPQIRGLLAEFPQMPSTVIMERIGWRRGKTVLFDRIHQLRPLFQPPDPAQRTDYLPGVWRSVICGSRRSTCRWGSGRPAGRRCW